MSNKLFPLVIVIGIFSSCASEKSIKVDNHEDTLDRIADLERAFGQQSIRLENIEDKLDLLYDKVETNRLSLENKRFVDNVYPGSENNLNEYPQRIVKEDYSIPELKTESLKPPHVKKEEEEESSEPVISITESEYNKFVYGTENINTYSPPRKTTAAETTPSKSRTAYPPITDEKISFQNISENDMEIKDVDLYKKGLSLYREGDYLEAIKYFNNYLKSSPEKDYIDNVYYWIGECHYGLGSYSDAIHQFMKVLSETPSGNKVPDSMLKAALAYFQMGNKNEAKVMIEDLINKYPNTNAAKIAASKAKTLLL
jgi:tol-pal system protein YbgF